MTIKNLRWVVIIYMVVSLNAMEQPASKRTFYLTEFDNRTTDHFRISTRELIAGKNSSNSPIYTIADGVLRSPLTRIQPKQRIDFQYGHKIEVTEATDINWQSGCACIMIENLSQPGVYDYFWLNYTEKLPNYIADQKAERVRVARNIEDSRDDNVEILNSVMIPRGLRYMSLLKVIINQPDLENTEFSIETKIIPRMIKVVRKEQ